MEQVPALLTQKPFQDLLWKCDGEMSDTLTLLQKRAVRDLAGLLVIFLKTTNVLAVEDHITHPSLYNAMRWNESNAEISQKVCVIKSRA